MRMTWFTGVLALMLVGSVGQIAGAAEIKVLAAGAVRSTVNALATDFEAKSGDKLSFTYGTVGAMQAELEKGTAADVVLLTPASIAALADKGLVQRGNHADLGVVGNAVAVKAGAKLPDISTPEAVKQTLLAAQAVAYADPATGASSGIHFAKVLRELGIAEQVNAKAKLAPGGAAAAKLVADGGAEIVVTQKSEILPVTGVVVVGPLPPSLQNATTYSAAMTKNANAPDASTAFVRYLTGPEGRAKFKAAGFDPPP
jgi:molybdate transport system substrate-binding protein